MNNKKGISPLIASVMLIGFTIAIGAFLAGFFKNLATNQAEEIEQQANPACQFSQVNVDDPTWDNTTVPPTFRMTIVSTGTHDLKINSVRFLYTSAQNFSSVKGNYSEQTVEAGDSLSIQITKDTNGNDISKEIDKVRLVSECSNQNIEIEGDEITYIS